MNIMDFLEEYGGYIAALALGAIGVFLLSVGLAVFFSSEEPTPPDIGPPSAPHDAIELVWQDSFRDGDDYEGSRELFAIELNRLTNEGCTVISVSAAIGGLVAVLECEGGKR